MDREIGTLTEAIALLDEYIAAYNELRTENARLLNKYLSTKTYLEHARAAMRNDFERECIF